MKILYAIQGTGNGHISRAREIVPLLQQYGEVHLLISGTQSDVCLSQTVQHQLHGFSFIFGKKGGVDHMATLRKMKLPRLVRDVRKLPLDGYQLILNDFEPVTAWSCKLKGLPSVALSHQASFESAKVPRPSISSWAPLIMKYYAPATHHIGFHFNTYDDFIHTPVIRSEIRNMEPSDLGHYTVYLPAMADEFLVPLLKQLPGVQWQVFSKHAKKAYRDRQVYVRPVNNEQFNISLASCTGLLTGGGFEGPAEALFLGKKLLLAPMNFQYEQQCNAFALEQSGLPVLWGRNKDWLPMLKQWVAGPQDVKFSFPDETAAVIDKVVNQFAR